MSTWWFPDNTVLCNFAIIERLDLLEKTLAGHGRWCEAVAYEAAQSSRIPGLLSLATVAQGGWLDEPIEIDQADAHRVEAVRIGIFGGSSARPLQHLGEAQTLFLLDNDERFALAYWLTGDRSAYDYAVRRGMLARTTVDIMAEAVASGDLRPGDGFSLLKAIQHTGRYVHRMPRAAAELAR
jgi:hypothetical protein